MEKYDRYVAIAAILAVLILELYALSQKINGTALTAAFSGLCYIGGYFHRGSKKKKEV